MIKKLLFLLFLLSLNTGKLCAQSSNLTDSLGARHDTIVYEGDALKIVAAADSTAFISYQWLHNRISLPGVLSHILNLDCIHAADTGEYTCLLTDKHNKTWALRPYYVRMIAVTADAGTDEDICKVNYTLNANTPIYGKGSWSTVKGSGSLNSFSAVTVTASGLSEGINIFSWTIKSAHCIISSKEVKITRFVPPTDPIAGNDTTICSSNLVLNANVPQKGVGEWSIIEGKAVFADKYYANTQLSLLDSGLNILRWDITNGVCKTYFDEVKITRQSPILLLSTTVEKIISINIDTLRAPQIPGAVGYWQVMEGQAKFAGSNDASTIVVDIAPGKNLFRWTLDNSCNQPKTFDYVINYIGKSFEIATLFTPNEDGINDKFIIPGIEVFATDNELTVYSRAGSLVYYKRNYQNDWNGMPNKGLSLANKTLEDDTYFYMLRAGSIKQTGYVVIRK